MALTLSTWLWRLVLAMIFLTAAWSKWQAGVNYMPPETIYDRLVAFSSFRHYLILLTETGIGIWLLSGIKVRWSTIAAAAMLLLFVGVLVAELFRKSPLNCGCGLTEVTPDGDPRVGIYMSIARNAVLLLGCAWLWLLGEDSPETATPEQASTRAESPAPTDQKQ